MEPASSAFSTGVPVSAAIPQLAGNSRQGFGLVASTSWWASGWVISSNTLGIKGSLYDGGIGSHYTGKERDAESGNDYFGARYYTSTMGRFMSPDWSAKEEPVPYAKLEDPQSLNLYAYMRNYPLEGFDPNGHVPFSWGGFEDCSERHDCNGGGQTDADVQANKAALHQEAEARAQQENPGSSNGPGFWGRMGQRFNNFFHSQGLVTNSELPDSILSLQGPGEASEPNPYVSLGLDAFGAAAAVTGHDVIGDATGVASAYHDPSLVGLVLTGGSMIPVVGDAFVPISIVYDAGSLADGVIQNNVMAPMINAIPGNTMDNGQGYSIPTPEKQCEDAGMC